MKTNKININGEELSYFDNEKGGTTLLFLHGAFIDKQYWNEQLSYFSEKYRVVAIDLPGHGKSSFNRKELTGQRFGKDVREFIKELSLENVVLIGHSFGSDVMLETVTENDTNIVGLIEIDHMKNVGMQLPKEVVAQIVAGLKADFENTCEQFARQALLTEATAPEIVSRLLKDYKGMNPEVGVPLLEYGFSYSVRETELLKGLELKLHCVHVNYTPTNEESLKKYLGDNYELYMMEGTCHYPMLENPNELNATLEKILSVEQKKPATNAPLASS
jgi:pimeloyl-ACP methyl ester carboxylesterase